MRPQAAGWPADSVTSESYLQRLDLQRRVVVLHHSALFRCIVLLKVKNQEFCFSFFPSRLHDVLQRLLLATAILGRKIDLKKNTFEKKKTEKQTAAKKTVVNLSVNNEKK